MDCIKFSGLGDSDSSIDSDVEIAESKNTIKETDKQVNIENNKEKEV